MNKFKFLNTIEKQAVEELASQLREKLSGRLIKIQFFGSKLRGDFREDADIDVLLVVKNRTNKVEDIVADIAFESDLKYDSHISIILLSEIEYNQNKAWETLFMQNVEREGQIL